MTYDHNGAPPLDDDEVAKLRYIKINIAEILEGIEELTWEQRGYYLTALFKMYARMGGLPWDEREGARIMRCDIRLYRRMRDHLLAAGKLYRDGEVLHNRRVEREIADYVREYRRRSDAAKMREEKRRAQRHDGPAEQVGTPAPEPVAADRAAKLLETFPEKFGELRETSARLPQEIAVKSGGLERESATISTGAPPRQAHSAHQTNGTPATTIEPLTINHKEKGYTCGPSGPHLPPSDLAVPAVVAPDPVEAAFEEFWRAFPEARRRGKGQCLTRFRKIVRDRQATPDELVAAVRELRGMDADPKFAPMPATWLNQGRWRDDPPRGRRRPILQPPAALDDEWAIAAASYERGA